VTKKPPQLLPGYVANFTTLRKACMNGDLALVSAIRKSDQAGVALICAMNRDGEEICPAPLAVMIEGNPYDLFEDPSATTKAANPKLGSLQRKVLQALVDHETWSAGCGWFWRNYQVTAKYMRQLVAKGWVTRHELPAITSGGVAYGPPKISYRPTQAAVDLFKTNPGVE
jgi:hypothetical protein